MARWLGRPIERPPPSCRLASSMQNPTTLQGWYNAAMHVSNTKSHIGILSSLAHAGKGGGSSHRDPDAMDVDAVMIQALSKEE